ncbi:MAG TPA: FecR domain-containing protein, partial [Parapedobacter sp.]|nr:FecR domain-containing protein [Parapedobacter sp.]
ETRTTLVEGAVVVRESPDGSEKKGTELMPGEESILTTEGLQTRKANLASSIAWKSGVFAFDNIPFDQMMRQIARWYDIDIIYEGAIPKEQFKGKMSRNVDLDMVISFLKDSGIDLNVEGRTIYIGNSIK